MKKIFWTLLCAVIFQGCSKSDSNSGGGGGGGTPSISALSYTEGIIGDTVKIIGVNFSATASDNTVEFNGVKATVVSSATSYIICVVPPGTTTGSVTVNVGAQASSNSKLFTVVSANIFITASDQNGNGVVLRNGVSVQTIKSKGVILTGIYVSGSDIYVCGKAANTSNGNFTITYWKNGTETDLTDGSVNNGVATSIWVSGNDVYVTGGDDSGGPKYWKNGSPVNLTNQNYTNSGTSSVVVAGGDVYISGSYYTSQASTSGGAYWKNGVQVNLVPKNSAAYISNVLPVYLSGNDVYVAGTVATYNSTKDSLYYQAAYWKNGVQVDLGLPADGSQANGIYVSGTDVFVSGNSGSSSGASYWKNANLVPLSPGQALTTGIAGDGSNIYILGLQNGSGGGYWINDAFNGISTSLNLAFVTSIFLQKTP